MPKYEIYKNEKSAQAEGQQIWFWRLRDDDDTIIAAGGEAFLKNSIKPSIKTVKRAAPDAPIWLDESCADKDKGYRFEYQKNGKWKFRAGNNQSMAEGDVGKSCDDAETALKTIRDKMGRAHITYENPEDDPAAKPRGDDNTETRGIPGSRGR